MLSKIGLVAVLVLCGACSAVAETQVSAIKGVIEWIYFGPDNLTSGTSDKCSVGVRIGDYRTGGELIGLEQPDAFCKIAVLDQTITLKKIVTYK